MPNTKPYKEILYSINSLMIKYFKHDSDIKSYLQQIDELIDFLLENIDDLKNEMLESCNKSFEHEYIDIIGLIYAFYPKELDKTKIEDLYYDLRTDFSATPY